MDKTFAVLKQVRIRKNGIFQLLKPEKLIFYGSWQKKKGFRNARKLSFWKCLCCCFHRKLPHSAVKNEKCAICGSRTIFLKGYNRSFYILKKSNGVAWWRGPTDRACGVKKKYVDFSLWAFDVIMQPHTICFCTIFPFLKHCMLERYLAEDWIFK